MSQSSAERKRIANERAKKWAKDFPEKARANQRKSTLKKRGVTLVQEAELFSLQGRACAICKTEVIGDGKTYWPVDHDHATGKVRGLLCSDCNKALGYFKDDTGFLANAISYLQNPPANAVLH